MSVRDHTNPQRVGDQQLSVQGIVRDSQKAEAENLDDWSSRPTLRHHSPHSRRFLRRHRLPAGAHVILASADVTPSERTILRLLGGFRAERCVGGEHLLDAALEVRQLAALGALPVRVPFSLENRGVLTLQFLFLTSNFLFFTLPCFFLETAGQLT